MKKKKNVWVGYVWKGVNISKLPTKEFTLSGVELRRFEIYKKKPWEAQKVRITVEEL